MNDAIFLKICGAVLVLCNVGITAALAIIVFRDLGVM